MNTATASNTISITHVHSQLIINFLKKEILLLKFSYGHNNAA